jgi:predicted Zn-dependent protease
MSMLMRSIILISLALSLILAVKAPFYVYKQMNSPSIKEASGDLKHKFDKLKKAAGPSAIGASLWIHTTSKQIQAVAWGDGSIVIHQGELTFNKNHPDAVVYVMAHELAHWSLGHLTTVGHAYCGTTNERHRKCEQAADLWAVDIMEKAGYNKCAAGGLWLRMLQSFGNIGGVTHPTAKQRYNYLRCK